MSRGRILIVDDSPVFLAGVAELLRGEHEVFCASRAEGALEVLARDRVDVIVSDYQMPGMDGLALLMAVKRAHPACARVLMTAYGDLDLVVRALNEGEIHRFIAKPCQPPEFRRIVGEALAIARLLAPEGGPTGARTVLVAHDSRITVSRLRLALGPDFTVLATSSGIEVLGMLGRHAVDALVTGVSLEHLDGCTIATYLKKEKRSPIPVVIWGRGIPPVYEEYLRSCGADLVLDEAHPDAADRLSRFLRPIPRLAGGGAPAGTG